MDLTANQAELSKHIQEAVPLDGVHQTMPGVYLARASMPLGRIHSVVKPSLCVVAQGSKEIMLGGSRYVYDPSQYLLFTVELPRTSQILDASPERPYLSFRLELDPALVSAVMLEAAPSLPTPDRLNDTCAMISSPLDAELQDAVLRLVRLAGTPAKATLLAPLVKREIILRLLLGPQGTLLSHLASASGYTPIIARAVERLREDIRQPLRMDQLAQELGVSVSGLHHHFKSVTAMSPLQYQKQLRLQEARRLMLSEHYDATSTAYHLGYHDAAHFSREYKSLFGLPPVRDIQQMRERSLDQARA